MRMLIFITALNLLFSCQQSNEKSRIINNSIQQTNSYKTNLKELGKYINLSNVKIDSTKKIYWNVYQLGNKNSEVPGPSDYYIIASFKLDEFNADTFRVLNILKQPMKKDSQYYKEWLPNNMNFIFGSENDKIEVPVYAINLFKKSPYLNGFFCISDDLDVYLFMNTQ